MAQEQNLNIARKKAELISAGRIFIPSGLRVPFPMSRSTAGPGAGTPGLVFLLNAKTRVKLGVIKDNPAKFELRQKESSDNNYQIYKDEELFIDNVRIVPTLLHAPSQAFINIASECIYDCKFCASPQLDRNTLKKPQFSNQKWAELIIKAAADKNFESVALTSAVPCSPERTVDDMIEIMKLVKAELGEAVPIGVEPYVTEFAEIDKLFEAGATELKLNIQSYDRDIFTRICPGLDYNNILKCIEYGVKVFGRNKVCSNLIIGLGESNENVLEGIEHLARLGVVVNLRAVRVNDYNKQELENALGFELQPVEPERLLNLAKAQQELLEAHNLKTTSFDTMCHKCGCCDIVPQQDI
ncbi:MAG: radical SAM protein [Thermoplasmata archaeon]|nr:radical SAM protein [Thermoplasmata archaeon]